MTTGDPSRVRKGRLIFLLAGLVFIIIPATYGEWQQYKAEEDYFNNLHLKLTGVIHYIEEVNGYNDFGIIGVHVLSSNITQYDQRSNPPYYCLIKGDSAELYCAIIESTVGDTVKIDTDKRQFTLLKKNGSSIKYTTGYNNENRFYKRFLTRHQRIKASTAISSQVFTNPYETESPFCPIFL